MNVTLFITFPVDIPEEQLTDTDFILNKGVVEGMIIINTTVGQLVHQFSGNFFLSKVNNRDNNRKASGELANLENLPYFPAKLGKFAKFCQN